MTVPALPGRVAAIATLVLAAAAGSIAAPAPTHPAARALRDTTQEAWSAYDLTQFITVRRGSPASILRLDDNGRLALLARDGIAEHELLERTGARESQVQLLVDWGLLARDGDRVRTAFPILDAARTAELRRWTAGVSGDLAGAVADDVGRLRARLEAEGRGANAFSIVFSYVLDGLTWRAWETSGAVAERSITESAPFWAGEVWATRPARADLVGTNRISDEGVALNVTWSAEAIPRMRPFVADWEAVRALFEDFAAGGPIVDPRARATFAPFDLFDADGVLTIPVVVEDPSDPIHALSRSIAETVAERAPAALDLPALRAAFGFRDDEQALVVAYHELMWDVLAALERRGVVERPPILARPDAASEADVAALVFGVRE